MIGILVTMSSHIHASVARIFLASESSAWDRGEVPGKEGDRSVILRSFSQLQHCVSDAQIAFSTEGIAGDRKERVRSLT